MIFLLSGSDSLANFGTISLVCNISFLKAEQGLEIRLKMPLFKKRGKMIVVFLYGNEDQYRFDVALFDCCPEKKRKVQEMDAFIQEKRLLRGFDSTSILHSFLLEAQFAVFGRRKSGNPFEDRIEVSSGHETEAVGNGFQCQMAVMLGVCDAAAGLLYPVFGNKSIEILA